LRLEARTFLKRLQRDLKITTVFVTHDQAEALALADRIAVLESGHLRQLGTPREVFQRPADTFVANFIGSTPMNQLDGKITGEHIDVAGARLPLPAELDRPDGSPIKLGIRPEYLTLHPDGGTDGITGTVSVVENLGVTALVILDCPDGSQLGVTVAEADEPSVGDTRSAVPEPGRILLFDSESGLLLT
jgi:multiple sugar transport system ATP-binding protein